VVFLQLNVETDWISLIEKHEQMNVSVSSTFKLNLNHTISVVATISDKTTTLSSWSTRALMASRFNIYSWKL